MPPTTKLFLFLGALNAALAVITGAFGSHGLEGKLSPDLLDVWEIGVRYHMYHALGLLLVGLIAAQKSGALMTWAGWMLFAGIVIFSGSLYLLALTGVRTLGAITPIGGTAFIIGWLLLMIGVVRK